MLQQTRVETVIPYFEKWLSIFPTVSDLADASETDVLSAWEGLGYYSRARNLRLAAQRIMDHHNGKLPENLEALVGLPGIGRYTAGAIISIAFNGNVTTLDGNIRRVFSRLFDVQVIVNSPEGEKILWELLGNELPDGKAGDFNQALMDLGATLCTPQNPDCVHCPLVEICLSRSRGVESERPLLRPKIVQPIHIYVCAIIQKEDRFLLTHRPSHGLLGGMWEFPNVRMMSGEDSIEKKLKTYLHDEIGFSVDISGEPVILKHAYTHFRMILHAYKCIWISEDFQIGENYSWVPRIELQNFPMGKIARQISKLLLNEDKGFEEKNNCA